MTAPVLELRRITKSYPGVVALLTGMIPNGVPDEARSALLDPAIVVPPLLWLVSQDSDGITGRRLVATKWQTDQGGKEAAEAAIDPAGWQ